MNVGRYSREEDSHVGTSRITKSKELKMNEQEFTPEQTDAPCPNCGVEHEDLCYHEGHGQYFCKTCWDKENKE